RCCAQRPLPSMMMATWHGSRAGSRPAAASRSRVAGLRVLTSGNGRSSAAGRRGRKIENEKLQMRNYKSKPKGSQEGTAATRRPARLHLELVIFNFQFSILLAAKDGLFPIGPDRNHGNRQSEQVAQAFDIASRGRR